MEKDNNYIMIYHVANSPHTFPKLVPKTLVLRDITYQTINI